jgi:hypothetical protein
VRLYKYAHVRASEQYIEELTTMFFAIYKTANVLPPPQRIVSDEAKHTQTRVHDLCRTYLTLVETVDLEGQDPFGTIECDRSTAMKQEKFIARTIEAAHEKCNVINLQLSSR